MAGMPLRGPALAAAPLLLAPDARPAPPPAPAGRRPPRPAGAAPAARPAARAAGRAAVWAPAWGVREQVGQTIDLLERAGWLGQVSIVLAFSAWVCVSLPATPMEVAAGFLYGPFWGFACGLFCKTAGSVAAFVLARYVGRRLGWQVPAALGSKLTALRTRPVLAMVGLRLAPLPLGVKNYGLGLSEVGLAQYLLAALLVDLPFSALWASTGASCHSLADALSLGEAPPQRPLAGRAVPAGLLLALAAWAACSWRRRLDAGIQTYVGTIAVDD